MLQKCYIYVIHVQENTFYFNYHGRYILHNYDFNFYRLYSAEKK